MTPDEHPRRHHLADGSSLYAPSPSLSSFSAASVMLCCSAPPASWRVPLRQSVSYRSTDLVVKIMCIRTFCEHINILHIFESFEVGLELLCHAWLEGPTLSSSALPRFLFPSFPPSSYLPRFLLPLLPHFLRFASLPPTFSSTTSSIPHVPSPSRWIELQSKQPLVRHLDLTYVLTRLVHGVSPPLVRKTQMNNLQRIYFHYQTVETIRIFDKIVYDCRRWSLPPAAAL